MKLRDLLNDRKEDGAVVPQSIEECFTLVAAMEEEDKEIALEYLSTSIKSLGARFQVLNRRNVRGWRSVPMDWDFHLSNLVHDFKASSECVDSCENHISLSVLPSSSERWRRVCAVRLLNLKMVQVWQVLLEHLELHRKLENVEFHTDGLKEYPHVIVTKIEESKIKFDRNLLVDTHGKEGPSYVAHRNGIIKQRKARLLGERRTTFLAPVLDVDIGHWFSDAAAGVAGFYSRRDSRFEIQEFAANGRMEKLWVLDSLHFDANANTRLEGYFVTTPNGRDYLCKTKNADTFKIAHECFSKDICWNVPGHVWEAFAPMAAACGYAS